MVAGRHKRHRTRPKVRAAAGDGHFERSLADHEHFLVNVLVGRMGRFAGSEFGLMQLDRKSGMCFAMQDGARAVRPVPMDLEVLIAEDLGRERGLLRYSV